MDGQTARRMDGRTEGIKQFEKNESLFAWNKFCIQNFVSPFPFLTFVICFVFFAVSFCCVRRKKEQNFTLLMTRALFSPTKWPIIMDVTDTGRQIDPLRDAKWSLHILQCEIDDEQSSTDPISVVIDRERSVKKKKRWWHACAHIGLMWVQSVD